MRLFLRAGGTDWKDLRLSLRAGGADWKDLRLSLPVRESSPYSGLTTDQVRTDAHEAITWDLIQITEHDPSLKALLEKSIAQAHAMNPDPDTNPVSDLESYYAFVDRCYRAMSWEIEPAEYDSLYERIDQGTLTPSETAACPTHFSISMTITDIISR